MKVCPFCAEEIRDDAIKCRYCMEFLDESGRPQGRGGKWYFSNMAVVIALLTVGPFALPLVWWNPRYRPVLRIAITVATLALSYWAYTVSMDFLSGLDEQLELLQELGGT